MGESQVVGHVTQLSCSIALSRCWSMLAIAQIAVRIMITEKIFVRGKFSHKKYILKQLIIIDGYFFQVCWSSIVRITQPPPLESDKAAQTSKSFADLPLILHISIII